MHLWNGVIPAWMEWVTAQDPEDCEVSPMKQSVALNGFFGILGTGRRVPAGRRQEGRNELVIECESPDDNLFNHLVGPVLPRE